MSLLSAVATLILLVAAAPVRPIAQCPPASPFPGKPYFDFQVEKPALYIGKDTAHIKPVEQRVSPPFPPDFALAQFVVDSLGVPVPVTLKMLVLPAALSRDAVMSALTEWRYQPAQVAGCRVAQLVQTPLRWQ